MTYFARDIYPTVSGAQSDFEVSFLYLSSAHVVVTVTAAEDTFDEGEVQVEGADYVFSSSSLIHFTTPPVVGAEVDIRRVTPREDLLIRFSGGTLTADSLNLLGTQLLYIAQEDTDSVGGLDERSARLPEGERSRALPTRVGNAGKYVSMGIDGDFYWASPAGDETGLRAELAASLGAALVGCTAAEANSVLRSVLSKLRDHLSVSDYTTLAAAITAAGATRDVDLCGQSVTVASAPVNTYGSRLKGGKVLGPSGISTYLTQLNTYADDAPGLLIGREYLSTWYKSIGANVFQIIPLFGDSTVEQNDLYVKSHVLFEEALQDAGINFCLTSNHGVSGTSWGDINVLPELGATRKLIVIKSGINDADLANPLTTMAAAIRAKFTAWRAASYGDYDSVSFLVIGPNATWRPAHNQDPKWYEDVRKLYIQLAHEFKFAYLDFYAWMQDARLGPGRYLDSFEGGQGLHPDPEASYWYWKWAVKDILLGSGGFNINKSNHFRNIAHATAQVYPTGEPQTYPMGISYHGVLTDDGWPASGALLVIRQADGVTAQFLFSLDPAPRTLIRVGSALVWTQWVGTPTAISVFANSWVNKGGGYQTAGYVQDDNGWVDLYGSISGGTLGAAAFNLPSQNRPSTAWSFDILNGTVEIFPDGNVIVGGTNNTHVRLSGIRFRVPGALG